MDSPKLGDNKIVPGFLPDSAVDASAAKRVAQAWASGGLVGLPTETVYGLSADADNQSAVARIYQVKGRPLDHPVIVHVVGPAALTGWARAVSPGARRLVERFWPGPLTVVLHRAPRARDFLTGGQETIALRAPSHPVAHACLRAFAELRNDPAAGVAAPSANRFGQVSPTSSSDVMADVGTLLVPGDLVVDGGRSQVGLESTIVDCTGAHPRVLRAGGISAADIEAVWGQDQGALNPPSGNPSPPASPKVPGTLAAHYAPHALVMVRTPAELVSAARSRSAPGNPADTSPRAIGLFALAPLPTPVGWLRVGEPHDTGEFAHELYAAFRAADAAGCAELWVVLPTADHALLPAIRDRVSRAAVGSRGKLALS